MTKETKIGLLVGLAFIILFAIILSEKGAGPRPQGAPQFTQVDHTRGGAERTGSTLVDAGKLPLPIEPVTSEARPARTKPGKASSSVGAVARQEPKADELSLPTLDSSLIGDTGEGRAAAVDSRDREGDRRGEIASAEPGSRSVDSALESAVNRTSLTARTESPSADATSRIPGEPVESTETSADTSAKGRTYVVQPGDTLMMIARRNYGTGKPSAIEAIMKANGKTIKNAHTIRVGQKLTIPATEKLAFVEDTSKKTDDRIFIESVDANNNVIETEKPETKVADSGAPKSESRTGTGSGMAKPPKTDAVARASGDKPRDLKGEKPREEKTAARVYEVRPRDTLQRIARRELGDAKRYKEIEELNRQILGRKSLLMPGMKLRLPAKDSASTTLGGESEASARRSAAMEMAAR